MTRPTPRRNASSRGGVQRPRKIAGQGAARPESADPAPPTRTRTKATQPAPAKKKAAAVPQVTPRATGSEMLESSRTTGVLIVVLAVLALIMATLGVLWGLEDGDEPPADQAGVSVPSDRPVVADELAVQDGVDAAAKAAQEIVAIDYNKYDDEVEAAVKLMTSSFEPEYRQTAEEIKADFVAQKTVVQANVVGQGVVTANRTRLQALVFLNQVVARTRDGKPETVLTPFKVLVTMVHTDKGWLVDGLDTDAPDRSGGDQRPDPSTPPSDAQN